MSSPGDSPAPAGPARRALRFWAAADVVHAAGVAWLAAVFVPWKLPAANWALIALAALHAGTAWPLAQGRRAAFRVAVATSLVMLVAAVAVTTGLVASWAYLRAIHGVFGKGASVIALFLAACVFQVLGLYPALRLRTLLRADVRALVAREAPAAPGRHPNWLKRLLAGPRGPGALALAFVLLPPGVALAVKARFALRPLPAVPARARAAALAYLRDALVAGAHGEAPGAAARSSLHAALGTLPAGPGPVFVQLFAHGRAIARVTGGSWDAPASLADALEEAGRKLAALPRASSAREARVKIDRTVAAGPVAGTPDFLLALSLDPGRDGLRVLEDPATPPVLPDDVLMADAYGAAPLLPFLDEVRLGLDAAWLRARLGNPARPRWQRFRTESWIECRASACAVERGRVTRPAPVPLADAARAATAFILRMQDATGRFAYQYLPHADATPPGPYNLARHAGTAYSLAMAAAALDDPGAGAGADRAIDWMAGLVARPCGTDAARACVVEPGTRRATTGVNALYLLALSARLRHVPDRAQEELARALASHVLAMQKPDGDFFHVFLLDEDVPDRAAPPHMFASEEAAFALVQAGRALQEPRLLDAAGLALEHLTGSARGQKYGHFLGRFTYGVDSWTCMAARAAHATGQPALARRAYLEFCLGYADFLRRLQFAPGEAAPDFDGHYGFSAVLVPQAPAAAGFAEALGAVAALARQHGRAVPELDAQLARALAALAADQIGADGSGAGGHLAAATERAAGGIRRSLVQSEIRIDFVQHALSAFLSAVRVTAPASP